MTALNPVIGLTPGVPLTQATSWPSVGLNQDLFTSVLIAGGLPVMLPLTAQPDAIENMLDYVDGVLITGGPDVDPQHWGEEPHPQLGPVIPERDAMELRLIRRAAARGTPLLGICRGMQMLTVAAGGTLWQDVPSQIPEAIQHSQLAPRHYPVHTVTVLPNTRLAGIMGRPAFKVNSFHHQAVRNVPEGWRVAARAPDGIIEAIEFVGEGFAMGVQWHPECHVAYGNAEPGVFSALVAAAVAVRTGR